MQKRKFLPAEKQKKTNAPDNEISKPKPLVVRSDTVIFFHVWGCVISFLEISCQNRISGPSAHK